METTADFASHSRPTKYIIIAFGLIIVGSSYIYITRIRDLNPLVTCKAESLQKCKGTEQGFWEDGSWVTPGCRYRHFDSMSIESCLSNKWIHFFGDSTSRHLYQGFLDLLGRDCAVVKTYDDTLKCQYKSFKISYLFRGKVMHQRRPRANKTEEADLHNSFLNTSKPDILVMNVGVHEAIGWTGRPRPSLNVTEFFLDTNEFFEFLPLVFNGSLIFWRGHDLKAGKVRGDDYLKARGYYDITQDYLWNRMRWYGATVLDFSVTTREQKAGAGGIHYPHLAKFHANLVLNSICK